MPVITGEGHLGHFPYIEIQGGKRLAGFDKAERIDLILAELDRMGGFAVTAAEAHGRDALLAVHDQGMLTFLDEASERAGPGADGMLFCDTFLHRAVSGAPRVDVEGLSFEGRFGRYCSDTIGGVGPGTYRSAVHSADCALTAADLVAKGGGPAFALCRPPGHHAFSDVFGGGAYLNNAAIAAEALKRAGFERVGIIDVDIHHGNGTQGLFYDRGDVFFASVHADPAESYPFFSGFADEVGHGPGKGANLNAPVPLGVEIDGYMKALRRAVDGLVDFNADALVVSLGVDGHIDDPVEAGRLVTDDYRRIGAGVGELGLPSVIVLEGGYALEALGSNIGAWISGFAR